MRLRRWKTGFTGMLCAASLIAACGTHDAGLRTSDHALDPWENDPKDPILPPTDLPVPPNAVTQSQGVGTLPGELEVSSSGLPTYTLPLLLPEGRAGMQPDLALAYDGSNRNGPAGVGFSVRGLSQVMPCRQTVAQDGAPERVRFAAGDEYCLDGVRLVPVEGNAGAPGAHYRLEEDRNIKIVSEGTIAGLGTPASFVAYHPDGRKSAYTRRIIAKQVEHTSPIGVAPSTRDVTFAWALETITDRSGNIIRFDYDVITPTAPADSLEYDERYALEYYPKQITYTLNDSGLTGHRSVYFYYENRPDPLDRYLSGVHVRTRRRLVTIEARAPYPTTIKPAWRYHLFYTQSQLSGRSLVEQVKMCDAFGSCLPATEFQWQTGSDAFVARSTGISAGTDLQQMPKTSTGDFNRDGRADVLFWDGRRQKCLVRSDGPRWVDDDGVGDFCDEVETYNVAGEWKIAFGNGSGLGSVQGTGLRAGFFTRLGPYVAEKTISGPEEYNAPLALDFDGDGATDLLSARTGEIRSPFLGGALIETIGSTFAGLPAYWEPDVRYLGDFDGDGRVDLFTNTNRPTPSLSTGEWGTEVTGWHGPNQWDEYDWAFRRGTGAPGFGSEVASTLTPYMQRHDPDLGGHAVDSRRLSATMDVDGDGRMELVVPQPGGSYESVELDSAGNPTSPRAVNLTYLWPALPDAEQYGIFSPTYLDINGDGLRDVIAVNGAKHKTSGKVELPARINTGQGFGPWYLATLGGYTPPAEQRDSLQIDRETSGGNWPANPMVDNGVRVFDFNSDGLDDFLVPTDDEPVIYVSNGRHFNAVTADFDLTPPVLETVYDEEAHELHGWFFGWTHKLADVTGDGQADLVQYDQAGRELEVWERAGFMPDKLSNVRNGLKRNESVVYGPLSDDKLYGPGTDCTFPVRCIHGGGQVVAALVRSAPGGQTHTAYSYVDARVDVQGRGHLGFRRRISEGIESDRKVTVEYGHDHRVHGTYPLAGVPVETRIDDVVDGARAIVQTTGTKHQIQWSFGNRVFRVLPEDTVERSYETALPPPATLSPSGARRSRITSRTWDEFGNLKTSDVRVSGRVVPETGGFPIPQTGTRTVSSFSYENRVSDWLIGLLTGREVTSHAAPPSTLATTRTTKYVADSQGRIVSIEEEPTDPRLLQKTTVNYGSYGQINEIITENSTSDPEAPHQTRVEKFVYDGEYLHPKRYTNAQGHETFVTVHPALGVPVIQLDANGFRVDHRYDGFGRHRSTNVAGGYGTTTSYEPGYAGPYLVRKTSTTGEESTREYNSTGLAFKLTAKGFDGKPVIVERVFDIFGNLREQSNAFADPADRRFTKYGYDGVHRVTHIDYPDGTSARNEYHADERRSWDQKGNESYIRFDVNGRAVLSADVYTDDGTAKPIVTRYAYGPFGALQRIVDHEGNERSIEHDRAGNQISIDDPDAGLRTMTYNGFGELIAQQDPVSRASGAATRYERDLLGRVTARKSVDGVDRYYWDQPPPWASGSPWYGARHGSESASGVREHTLYDGLGRPATERTFADGAWYEVGYAYDSASRVSEVHYPNVAGTARFKTQHFYGFNGALARIDEIGGGMLWAANERDAIGRVEDEQFGNDVRTKYDFDVESGRLRMIHGSNAAGEDIHGLKYKYDDNGNVILRQDFVMDRNEGFDHDSLDRLTRWDRKLGTKSAMSTKYDYDFLGNLKRRTQSGGKFAVVEKLDHVGSGARPNSLTRYRRTMDGSTVADFSPSYDDSGRRISAPWDQVEYTSFDLPRSVSIGGDTRTFAYDADQNRVLETGKDLHVITIGKLYERRLGAAEKRHVFRISSDTGAVAERTFDEATGATKLAYVHRDHLGSGVALTDGAGSVSERRYFTPFGDVTDAAGVPSYGGSGAALASGFTGHDHDGELGLIDMNGRVYDPLGSSFMTPDPVVAAPLFGQALNRYSYVWNNPLKLTDPSGLIPEYDASIDMWVDEDPRGVTVYPGLEPADMEFIQGEGICTSCEATADDDAQESDVGCPPGGDGDAPPGGDDNVDDAGDRASEREQAVRGRQDYVLYARESVWDTTNQGESWSPTRLPFERVVARISIHVTFDTDANGQRQAYFDPSTDVEIAIESAAVSPVITVDGRARNVGGEPEVAFTISIQDSESVTNESSDTQNSAVITSRAGADDFPLGVSGQGPTSSRTRGTVRQSTVQRGYRARGVIRERLGAGQHPQLPQRARLPQHGGSPAGLPSLSAGVRLHYEGGQRSPPARR